MNADQGDASGFISSACICGEKVGSADSPHTISFVAKLTFVVGGHEQNRLARMPCSQVQRQRKQWDQVLKKFVQRWEGQRRIEVNGPWPPYSFVSDAD